MKHEKKIWTQVLNWKNILCIRENVSPTPEPKLSSPELNTVNSFFVFPSRNVLYIYVHIYIYTHTQAMNHLFCS